MVYADNITTSKFYELKTLFILMIGLVVALAVTLLGVNVDTTHAANVKQVSTGAATACAVTDGNVKCWGANDYGQLGNGSTTKSSTPVLVSKQAGVLAGKVIEKVSVGLTHACAIADAQVYCWGDNSRGQLGNQTTTNSSVPVAADTSSTASSTTTTVCTSTFMFLGFIPVCTASKNVTTTKEASALSNKEIVDISAGDLFTCALASDGSVSCWGNGENGRLGTNSNDDSTYPHAIYNAAGTVFAGKKGIRLAKAAGATMCVIATEGTAITSSVGSTYCWGYGIDDGTSLPVNGISTVACSKNTPTTRPAETTVTNTYVFQSNKPVSVPNATFASIDGGNDYVTGQSADGRAYYWGMYGYIETAAISNVTTCVVNPCTSRAATIMQLALTSTQQKAKAANTGGGDKKTNLAGGNKATTGNLNSGSNGTANGLVTTTTGGTYSTTGSSWQVVGNPATGYQTSAFNQNHYQGTAVPGGNYSAPATSNVGNNKNNTSTSCANQTHYGYTKNATYKWNGQKVATVPPAWSSTQGNFTALSGNVFAGLYCASAGTTATCDAHGTSVAEGQTGSNYTQQCTTAGVIFTATVCDPAPSGPQQVVSNGWLAGKSITSLNTGTSGYTCALANGSVGCWGINTYGQLGDGSTTNKNVPTAVNL